MRRVVHLPRPQGGCPSPLRCDVWGAIYTPALTCSSCILRSCTAQGGVMLSRNGEEALAQANVRIQELSISLQVSDAYVSSCAL